VIVAVVVAYVVAARLNPAPQAQTPPADREAPKPSAPAGSEHQ